MSAKKQTAAIRPREGTERPPTHSLILLGWFPIPGLAAMHLLMMAGGVHHAVFTGAPPHLQSVVWAHLLCQLLIGMGVTTAIVRHLNLEAVVSQEELSASIRRAHLTGWLLQALAALCFAAYMLSH